MYVTCHTLYVFLYWIKPCDGANFEHAQSTRGGSTKKNDGPNRNIDTVDYAGTETFVV